MLLKINRQTAIKNFPKLPLREYNFKLDDYKFHYPTVFANHVLTLPSKSYKGHVKLLGEEFTSIAKYLQFDHLIFLGDENIPWLYRDHDYKPASEGLEYLKSNKIGKRFNGALQVDTIELSTFIKHLAWLVRTNAVLPYVHFVDPSENIIGNICQYGNLHISTTTKAADKEFKKAIAKSRLRYLKNKTCFNKFSNTTRIRGRQITM